MNIKFPTIGNTCSLGTILSQMRILLFVISFFLFSRLFGQTSKNFVVFKTEDFTSINLKISIKTEKIRIDSVIDLYFFRKHFFIPYYFPETLIDKSYKNQIVTVWSDTTIKMDYKINWTHTYTYDIKSRVTDYSFSSCLVCSNLPYTIKLFYNESDKVVKMKKYYSLKIPTVDGVTTMKLSKPPQAVETFILAYDTKGNIIQLDYFVDEILRKRISKS